MNLRLSADEIRNMSALGLAHIGDGVFELMVRSWLCSRGVLSAKKLHGGAVSYVCAKSQAAAAKRLLPYLFEEELTVFRRGRNTRVNTIPRGSSLEEYHMATGLEALFGYLYLSGAVQRLNELFKSAVSDEDILENKQRGKEA